MRIIAGEFGGRVLRLPKDAEMRPTSDRVREALFSTLENIVELNGATVLDLYAGSGSLGLEALSRGAQEVKFIESNADNASIIRSHVEQFGLENRAQVVKAQVESALKKSAYSGGVRRSYRLVFADPPYDEHPGLAIADWVIRYGHVSQDSILVIESSAKIALAEVAARPAGYSQPNVLKPIILKEKLYGDTRVSYFGFSSENMGQLE